MEEKKRKDLFDVVKSIKIDKESINVEFDKESIRNATNAIGDKIKKYLDHLLGD